MALPCWCLAAAAVGPFLSPLVVVVGCVVGCVLAGCTGGMIGMLVVVGMGCCCGGRVKVE